MAFLKCQKNENPLLKRIRRIIVQDFFQEDAVSRLCIYCNFKQVKKQKRYLNGSILNIYNNFKKAHPNIRISYQSFCQFRPFWVLKPSVRQRDTCVCIVHDNMALLTSRAKVLNIIEAKDPDALLKELCCDVRNENCLERTCKLCVDKSVRILEFEKDEKVKYEKWCTKKVEIMIKGQKKLCQKTAKEQVECTTQEMLDKIRSNLKSFMIHTRNILHPYKCVDDIKKSLSFDEVLFHIDFSENYNCKYTNEIQSAHFGGSKPQVTLHTVVMYYKVRNEDGSGTVLPISLCTFSDSMRHDPAAICAHLEPVMKEALQLIPSLNTAFFLSDGPSTQYKNKKMFYLMAKFLTPNLKIQKLRWVYSEPGHGKGAPDGVGGCLKRIADNLVSQGTDIPNFKTLVEQLKENCKGIKCLTIDSERITIIEGFLPDDLKTFKGTMSIGELTWVNHKPNVIEARKLSCLICHEGSYCAHFGLGSIQLPITADENCDVESNITTPTASASGINHIRLRFADVYSDSDDEEVEPRVELNDKDRPTTSIENDYVIVKLTGKKTAKNFIGLILGVGSDSEYTVKFLIKCGANKFTFSEKDDISIVMKDEVLFVLSTPIVNKRQQYIFNNLPPNIIIS